MELGKSWKYAHLYIVSKIHVRTKFCKIFCCGLRGVALTQKTKQDWQIDWLTDRLKHYFIPQHYTPLVIINGKRNGVIMHGPIISFCWAGNQNIDKANVISLNTTRQCNVLNTYPQTSNQTLAYFQNYL